MGRAPIIKRSNVEYYTRSRAYKELWPCVVEAILAIAVFIVSITKAIHHVEPLVEIHEGFFLLFPVLGTSLFATIIPCLMYISFIDQFGKQHMMWPPTYVRMVRLIFRTAFSSGRVTAKDL